MTKYKLIDPITKLEYLCNKIILDGFIYYVGDNKSRRGWFYCYRRNCLFKDEGVDVNCCISDVNVIATNNTIIDIPKFSEVPDYSINDMVEFGSWLFHLDNGTSHYDPFTKEESSDSIGFSPYDCVIYKIYTMNEMLVKWEENRIKIINLLV